MKTLINIINRIDTLEQKQFERYVFVYAVIVLIGVVVLTSGTF